MNFIAPPANFWRHTATVRRKAWSADASLGMSAANADAGQTIVCTVQERSQDTRPDRRETNDAITASRFFDVLIPRINPATGVDQFPTGPAIRLDDTIVWHGRTLRVLVDVDDMGRGGHGIMYTAYCAEIV